jgi:hypothetical protein
MSLCLTKGFCPGFIFLGCLMVLSSFFDPRSTKMRERNLSVAQQDKNILVNVKSTKNNNKTQFYMFNISGELVKEYNINGSQKIIISQLPKGIYLYEFFSNDERLKNGEIELK